MAAEVKYAKSGDVHIACRVFGNGPRDVVLVPGTVSHVELYWELPANQYLLKRLASFSRVIVFDKRGQGLSDRVGDQTLEERVDDVLAVMNAAASDRATIYGWSEGGQLSLTLAATHPERVSGLVLYGTYASIDVSRESYERFLEKLEKHWGEGVLVDVNAPSRRDDEAFVQWFGRLERAVASPGSILALLRANYEIDVRDLLPSIHVPALILHREATLWCPSQLVGNLAEHIPGAKYVELPGADHLLQALDQDLLDHLLDEVEEFITGTRPRPHAKADLLCPTAPAPDGADSRAPDEAIAELERCREILACGEDGPGLPAWWHGRKHSSLPQEDRGARPKRSSSRRRRRFDVMGWCGRRRRHFKVGALHCGLARIVGRRSRSSTWQSMSTVDRARAVVRSTAARATRTAPTVAPLLSEPPRHAGRVSSGRRLLDAVVARQRGSPEAHEGPLLHRLPARASGRQVLARDLAAAKAAGGNERAAVDLGGTAADLGDAGALLDDKAREQYRRRIGELREELAEAVRCNDPFRAASLRSEHEALRQQIVGALGLGGRNRKAAWHSERARLMVTKAIKTALAKIRASDASLGRHLATSIKTGNYCAYDPGPLPPGSWQL
jgi:pimeloyl-ACP methyl ester carboxylesterase